MTYYAHSAVTTLTMPLRQSACLCSRYELLLSKMTKLIDFFLFWRLINFLSRFCRLSKTSDLYTTSPHVAKKIVVHNNIRIIIGYRLTVKHGSHTQSIDGIEHVFQVDSSPVAASSRSSGRAGPWRRRRPFARKRDARSPAACTTACAETPCAWSRPARDTIPQSAALSSR